MSPEVWVDAQARISKAAASFTPPLPVQWPLEDLIDHTPGNGNGVPESWLDIEAAAAASNIIEIGGNIWKEEGTIYLHVMVPNKSGFLDAITIRKTLSEAFRAVPDAPPGLFYRDQDFDPLGPGGDDGTYNRLSLLVRYDYQDTSAPQWQEQINYLIMM